MKPGNVEFKTIMIQQTYKRDSAYGWNPAGYNLDVLTKHLNEGWTIERADPITVTGNDNKGVGYGKMIYVLKFEHL